jgi:hypothetical protein
VIAGARPGGRQPIYLTINSRLLAIRSHEIPPEEAADRELRINVHARARLCVYLQERGACFGGVHTKVSQVIAGVGYRTARGWSEGSPHRGSGIEGFCPGEE